MTAVTTITRIIRQIDLDEAARRRAMQEAISYALAGQWRRRAETFEDAVPRPGDFTGRATQEELVEATERCRLTALACRQRAALIDLEAEGGGDD